MAKRTPEIPLSDAAFRLGVSWHAAWRLVLTRRLEGRKDGRAWVVTLDSVEREIHARAEAAESVAHAATA